MSVLIWAGQVRSAAPRPILASAGTRAQWWLLVTTSPVGSLLNFNLALRRTEATSTMAAVSSATGGPVSNLGLAHRPLSSCPHR